MSLIRRVIVVDRDPKVRSFAARALRPPEFEAHTFATAADALAHCDELRPDCIVSDAVLPDMTCEGLMRALRERPAFEAVPFVVLSVARSESKLRTLLEAGADAFVLKPFPLRELLGKVRSLTASMLPSVPPSVLPATAAADPRTEADSVTRALQPLAALAASVPGAVASAGEPATVSRAAASAERGAGGGLRIEELSPPEAAQGLGRYTRVDRSGRSLVVLTEANAQPHFVVTTVIAEKGWALRKIATELPHALVREGDRELVRRQIDLQHEDVLGRLDSLVLDLKPRRVVWARGLVP